MTTTAFRFAAALLCLLCSFVSVRAQGTPPAIDTLLDAWHAAAACADENAYFSSFAPNGIFLGTDASERWTVTEFRTYAHPYFAKGKAWTFVPRDRKVDAAADGNTAWFDELLDSPHLGVCRGSGVLVRLGENWRIAQYNLSIPIPNDLAKDFVARIADYGRTASGASLRAMTFNIRYDNAGDGEDRWSKRVGNVVAFLKAQNPDVIGLQEALRSQLDDLARSLPGYAELGVGRDDGKTKGEYAAILYRTERWRPTESGTFWLSDTPEVVASKGWGNKIVRVCTWARFEPVKPGDGSPFYFFNVHLDHESQPSRERSVVLMHNRIAARALPDPVIITGDFNAGEDNKAVRAMTGEEPLAGLAPGAEHARTRFIDSFRAIHPDETQVGTFNAFRGAADGSKIDYIFITPGVRVKAAAIHRDRPGGRDLSDHFPVTADLVLPPPASPAASPAKP